MGIEKLSLILVENNSINVAINAPKTIVILKLNKNPVIQHVIKHAMEPDKVLPPILKNG